LSWFLMNQRMRYDRGRLFTIGMSWWRGGAYQLATTLNYDIQGLTYVGGDITALDKHVPDFLIALYVLTTNWYYDFTKLSAKNGAFIKKLIRVLATTMTHKLVLHLGGVWEFMRGVVWSGGLETSHCDTFVKALVWFCYIISCVDLAPGYEGMIMEFCVRGFLAIVVYGDDHIWCYPKCLGWLINAKGYAEFLKRVFRMELRDYKEFDSLISVPSPDGGLAVVGPKFLKRYFIRSTNPKHPPIISYKPIDGTMIRLLLHSTKENPIDMLMSSVGQAYDAHNNRVAYEAVCLFHDTLKSTHRLEEPIAYLKEAMANDESRGRIVKLSRRLGMRPEEIFQAFPSWDRLEEMNIFDPHAVRYDYDDKNYLDSIFFV